jgi:HEAT repeat protein
MTTMAPAEQVDWLALAREILAEISRALARYGVAPDSRLRVIAGDAPMPYYEHSTLTIGLALPDSTTAVGRLFWMFVARSQERRGVEEGMAVLPEQLPFLLAHELAHHLRHRYDADSGDNFLEEQVANIIALAFVAAQPHYRAVLDALARAYDLTRAGASGEQDRLRHGFRWELGDVLVAEGELAEERLAEARQVAHATSMELERVLVEGRFVSADDIAAAVALQARTREHFNASYMADLEEYGRFFAEWLPAYLRAGEIPPLGTVVARHLLAADRYHEADLALTMALRHPDTAVAAAAAGLMAESELTDAVAPLTDAARHARDPVRAASLWALSRLAPERAESRTAGAEASEAPDPRVRAAGAVLLALGESDQEGGAAVIAALLGGDREARRAGLEAVEVIADVRYRDEVRLLLASPFADERCLSVRALAALPGHPSTAPALIERLRDPDDEVRLAAVDGLARERSPEALAGALGDETAAVRARAAVRLRERGPEAAYSLRGVDPTPDVLRLRQQLRDPEAPEAIRAMIAALAAEAGWLTAARSPSQGSARARLLAQALSEEHWRLAKTVARLAGDLADPAGVDLALRALEHDPDSSFGRSLAAQAVPDDLATTVRALLDQKGAVSSIPATAEQARERLRDSPQPVLRELLEPDDPPERQHRPAHSMLTAIEKLIYLRAVPLFSAVEVTELRSLVDHLAVEYYAAGEVVFAAGQPSDALYVIAGGRIAIQQTVDGVPRRVRTLGTGEAFGEMSMLSNHARSADAIAARDTTLLALPKREFQQLARRQPRVLEAIVETLSGWLRGPAT